MINYAAAIFTKEFTEGDKQLYAAFHPEVMTDTAEYAVTKRWLVVLLHPEFGLQTFFILHNDLMHRWEMNQHGSTDIEDEWVQWCGKQVDKQR